MTRPSLLWKLACYLLAAALLYWVVTAHAEQRRAGLSQHAASLSRTSTLSLFGGFRP